MVDLGCDSGDFCDLGPDLGGDFVDFCDLGPIRLGDFGDLGLSIASLNGSIWPGYIDLWSLSVVVQNLVYDFCDFCVWGLILAVIVVISMIWG